MILSNKRHLTTTAALGGVLFATSVFGFGCGSDTGSEDSSAIESGVAPNKQLSGLTVEEASVLCDATVDVIVDNLSLRQQLTSLCTIEASVLAVKTRSDGESYVDQQTCERTRDACVARVSLPPNAVPLDHCNEVVTPGGAASACHATVEDFERCAGASVHRAAAVLSQWDCAYLAKQPVKRGASATTETELPPLAECADYEAKCGELELLGSSAD